MKLWSPSLAHPPADGYSGHEQRDELHGEVAAREHRPASDRISERQRGGSGDPRDTDKEERAARGSSTHVEAHPHARDHRCRPGEEERLAQLSDNECPTFERGASEPEMSRREHREAERALDDVAPESDGEKDCNGAMLNLPSCDHPGQDRSGGRGEVTGALLHRECRERACDPARHPPRLPRDLLRRRTCFDLIEGTGHEFCRSRILWLIWVGGNQGPQLGELVVEDSGDPEGVGRFDGHSASLQPGARPEKIFTARSCSPTSASVAEMKLAPLLNIAS